ncbi:MAG: hypothetical protein ORN49_04960, partial [Rhodobacteraceae bacterium]|nr:hypothetical protein [Paracoccaceae bacterium]
PVALLSATAFCLSVALAVLSPLGRGLILDSLNLDPGEKVFLMGWALLLVPFVAWNVHQPGGRLDRSLGDLSFPLYLAHWPTIALLKPLWGGQPGLGGKALILLAILAVTLLLYRRVDRPLEGWRRRMIGA